MAKKGKRRGRPPGSKNKKAVNKAIDAMEVAQLGTYIQSLRSVLAAKIAEQRSYLERQLSELQGFSSKATVYKARGGKGSRGKAKPKYQSKKDRSVKWSGRGIMPLWMREEMKGTKLTKHDFLIK